MAEIKLKKKYKYAGDIFRKLIDIGFDIETATAFLNEVADADVVPVVRCCDCKHSQENPDINNTCYLTCNKIYGIQGTIAPDDYCSYGERKCKNG